MEHNRRQTDTELDLKLNRLKDEIIAACRDLFADKLVQFIVYYGIGLVLTGVVGALLSLVITKYK